MANYNHLMSSHRQIENIARDKNVVGVNIDLYPGAHSRENIVRASEVLYNILQSLGEGSVPQTDPQIKFSLVDPVILERAASSIISKYKELPGHTWPAVDAKAVIGVMMRYQDKIHSSLYLDSEDRYRSAKNEISLRESIDMSPISRLTIVQDNQLSVYVDKQVFRVYRAVYALHGVVHGAVMQPLSITDITGLMDNRYLEEIIFADEGVRREKEIDISPTLANRQRVSESNANRLTRYILLPQESLEQRWEKTEHSITKTREYFTVPHSMVIKRVRELGIADEDDPNFRSQLKEIEEDIERLKQEHFRERRKSGSIDQVSLR